jgi:hypothetical protein
MIKIEGSGSFSQRHGSPDPDPHQNVMDPEHCVHDNLQLSEAAKKNLTKISKEIFFFDKYSIYSNTPVNILFRRFSKHKHLEIIHTDENPGP